MRCSKETDVPQRLKPFSIADNRGTAEAVP
jgi:hypothetical protein